MLLNPCPFVCFVGTAALWTSACLAADDASPEAVVRALVRANAEKDIHTMSRLMAHDADITSYTIGGRKYVGWSLLEQDLKEEFESAATIEIPIRELTLDEGRRGLVRNGD
jgi:hypothetical protein